MAKHQPMIIQGVTVTTIADAKRANKLYAERTGRAYWFDKGASSFFNTRVHGGLIGARYFVTSERMDSSYPWKWTVHEVMPDGRIGTIGEFQAYGSLEAAKDKAKALAKMGEGIPSNPVKPGHSAEVVSSNVRKLLAEGHSDKEAAAIALKSARLSYRKENPKGVFPARLKAGAAKSTTKKVASKKGKVPKGVAKSHKSKATCSRCGKFHTTAEHAKHATKAKKTKKKSSSPRTANGKIKPHKRVNTKCYKCGRYHDASTHWSHGYSGKKRRSSRTV